MDREQNAMQNKIKNKKQNLIQSIMRQLEYLIGEKSGNDIFASVDGFDEKVKERYDSEITNFLASRFNKITANEEREEETISAEEISGSTLNNYLAETQTIFIGYVFEKEMAESFADVRQITYEQIDMLMGKLATLMEIGSNVTYYDASIGYDSDLKNPALEKYYDVVFRRLKKQLENEKITAEEIERFSNKYERVSESKRINADELQQNESAKQEQRENIEQLKSTMQQEKQVARDEVSNQPINRDAAQQQLGQEKMNAREDGIINDISKKKEKAEKIEKEEEEYSPVKIIDRSEDVQLMQMQTPTEDKIKNNSEPNEVLVIEDQNQPIVLKILNKIKNLFRKNKK